MAGARRLERRRRVPVVWIVGGVVLAVVASVLTVNAVTGPYDVSGDRIDMKVDELAAMKRPGEAKGVKLDDPGKEKKSEGRALLPLEAKEKCEKSEIAVPELGIKKGQELCGKTATRQSKEALDRPRFKVAKGSKATRIPDVVELPEPEPEPTATEPTPSETDETPGPDDEGGDDDGEVPLPSPTASSPSPGNAAPAYAPASPTGFTPALFPQVEPSGDGTTFLSPNWVQSSSTGGPAAGYGHEMAYDPVREQIVMFGGAETYTGARLDETWTWSNGVWTQLSPAHAPSPRATPMMAWDPVRQAIVLFGGNIPGGTFYNDTWTWDGTDWTKLTMSGSVPSTRSWGAFAYDPVRDGLVLFGGYAPAGARLNDTWFLASGSSSWTQIQANGVSGAPSIREGAGLAYSESTSQLVLFGGASSGTGRLNDTWVLPSTGSSWTQQHPDHSPPARMGLVMAFDPGIDGIVMFGGADASATVLNDTWAWTGDDWLVADGIAAPPGLYSAAATATPSGQLVVFGGATVSNGSTTTDKTWVYDAGLPLLDIEVTKDGGAPSDDLDYFYVGESAKIRITAKNAGVAPIESENGTTITSALTDTLLAAGSQVLFGTSDAPVVIDPCSGVVDDLCGGVADLVTTIANIEIPALGTRVADFVATVAGTQRGCELIDIPAMTSSIFGGSAEVATNLTVCGGGLGIEDWWTYDTTDLGNGGVASVNVANGNLVVKQDDFTPVQTPGRLAMSLSRVYNSQDLMSGGGPLGAGWQFDIGDTGEFAGGFGLAGFSLPNLQNVLQPLSMPYIDRDGTRHVFKLRSITASVPGLSLPIDLSDGLSSVTGIIRELLNSGSLPFELTPDPEHPIGYTNLCIDQAYTGPPGSDMFLFRYIGVGSANACANPASASPVQVGWSLLRPDRVRYDFDVLGNLLAVTDPAGQQLIYTPGAAYGPTKVVTASCGDHADCPRILIDYNAGGAGSNRHVKVTDAAGRVTSYIVSSDAGALVPQLIEVWEPGNPYSTATGAKPTEAYTYSTASTPCPGSVSGASTIGQLCSVTDAAGAVTKVTYEKAPKGPDRVKTVTDRRGTVSSDGATKGLATAYTWDDTADFVTADMAAPSTLGSCSGNSACQRVRYSDIDDAGRVGQIAEGSANNVFLRQTGYFWDGGAIASCSQPVGQVNNNLCQTITRAVPSNDPFVPGEVGTATQNSVTVHDQATDYTYGHLGQLLRQRVLLDAGEDWDDANSAITTWGTRDQYFDANGEQRAFDNRVEGQGEIASSGSSTNYRKAVLDDNPVAYWQFSESSGTTMKSETGTNNGTYASGVTLGRSGAMAGDPALGEKTTGASATVTSLSGFAHGTTATDSDFTIDGWMKTNSTAAETTVQWGNSGTQYASVGRLAGGLPSVFLASDTSASKGLIVYSTTSVADGAWHHVAYTYDGSGDAAGVKIYIDGVLAPKVTYLDTLDGEFAASSPLALLGGAAAESDLDDLALYPRVLSESELGVHRERAYGGIRVEADTLYGVTDQIQELSPRGNSTSNWGDYLTAFRRDIPADGTVASTNKPADDAGICGSRDRGNTGVLCETDVPASAGVAAGDCVSPTSKLPAGSPTAPTSSGYTHTCTTYTYNDLGQREQMRTPKAHETGSNAHYEYAYYDTVTSCSGANAKNCDLSGSVAADGWLKSVTDPDGKFVAYAYDAAGNIARTWDRNATAGKSVDDDWADADAPPSREFTDTVAGTPVTSDALSVSNTALITVQPDGTVMGNGTNGAGELGDGSASPRSTPVPAKVLTNVVEVAQSSTGALAACSFTAYRTGAGEVWLAGNGTSTPAKIAGLKDIIDIAVGGCHVMALDAKGDLWAFGTNSSGQIGNGSTAYVYTPTKIQLDDGAEHDLSVAAIGAGYAHSLAVTTDGRLFAWGNNSNGQLGVGDTSNRNTPTKVEDLRDLRAVSGGVTASYAIRRDGTVWSWGANSSGGLGQGDTTQRTSPAKITTLGPGTSAGPVRQVVGSGYGAAALMADGTVRAWGINNSGQLGGATGDPTSTSPVKVPGVEHQVAIAGGWATWATADQAGGITVWGATGNHQVGSGDVTTPSTPKPAAQKVSPYRLPWRFARGTRDATGNLSTMTVDRVGNVRATRTGRGNETFTSMYDTYADYDQAQRQVWSISAANRDGAHVASTEYDVFGNPLKRIDPRGNATRMVHDKVNRQVASAFTRDSADAPSTCTLTATSAAYSPGQDGDKICITSTTYDGVNRTVTATDANSQVVKTWSDAAGRKVQQDTPRNDGTYATLTSRWRYDKDGNVVTACSPRQFATDETGHTSSCAAGGVYSTDSTWDRAGKLSKQQQYRAGGSTTTLATSFSYDADGNQTAVTDANGHTTTTAFDLQARRTSMTKPRTGSISYTTRWSYDPAGNVTAVRAPGSLNIGSGADGHLVVDGTTGANSTDGVAHGSGNPFQIPDGAQYRSVTLQNGAYVTAADDHGLMFHATETVTVCATCVIDMAGQGYGGGAGGTALLGGDGSDAQNPNEGAEPGNGGTGGSGNTLTAGAGGGGGGHKAAGGIGGYNNPGIGGLKSGTSDFTDVGTSYLRGAGGGGGGGGKGLLGVAGNGGNGGGYVRITATKIVVDGTVNASGVTGGNGTSSSGGGGGGAGGGIWLAAPTINLGSSTTSLNVAGGAGGTAPNSRNGGNGSAGYIRIDADTLTNEPADVDRSKAAMITAYSYDAANRVIDTIEGAQTLKADPAADHGEFAVPDPHGLANTRTRTLYDADGRVGAMLPPQAFSNTASLTDPNTNTARRVDYDLDGRVKTVYSPRYDSGTTSIGSGDDGNAGVNQQTAQCKTGRTPDTVDGIGGYAGTVGVCMTRTEYDPNGNVAVQWLPTSNSDEDDERYLTYSYTPDNLAYLVNGPDPDGSGRADVAKTRFDAVGQALSVTDADGNTDVFSYTSDRLRKTTEPQGYDSITHETTTTYDANGNVRTVTDPRGNVTTNAWTSDNLLASVEAPGTGSGFNTTTYTYDKVGNPTAVLMPQQEGKPAQAVRNQYTDDNLLAATHTPVAADDSDGVESYRSVAYAHAPSGAKVATETAKCVSGTVAGCTPSSSGWDTAGVVRLTYGANGRVADQVGRSKSSITTTYAQHGGAKTISDPISSVTIEAGYYLDGLPRTVDDGSNENTYAYDASGQVTVRTDDSSLTGNDPVATSYAYSDAGLVVHMDSGVLGDVTDYEWLRRGLLKKETTGSHVNDWSWHPDDTVAGVKTTAGGSTKADFQYGYDNNGDITSQTVTGAEAYTNTYTYTPGRNVASWTVDLDGLSPSTVAYGWDKNNNRTTVTVDSTLKSTTSYRLDNSISHVDNASGPDRDYTYNDAGLLTDDDCNTNSYDDFDRIKTVHASDATGCADAERTTTYAYDGLDRQRSIAVDKGAVNTPDWTTRSVYDGLSTNLVGQTDAANEDESTPDVLYQLDPAGRQVGLEQSGAGSGTSFLDTDGHGNVTTQVTTGGTVACAVKYEPFGNPIDVNTGSDMCVSGSSLGSTGNSIWYRGQPRDASTGNYQLGTRTYDPATGTFTTPDAYRISDANTDLSVGTDPLTANTYTYVNGNPLNLMDSSGHYPTCSEGGKETCDLHPVSKKMRSVRDAKHLTSRIRTEVNSFLWQFAVTEPDPYTWGQMHKDFGGGIRLAAGQTVDTAAQTYIDYHTGYDIEFNYGTRAANWVNEQMGADPYSPGGIMGQVAFALVPLGPPGAGIAGGLSRGARVFAALSRLEQAAIRTERVATELGAQAGGTVSKGARFESWLRQRGMVLDERGAIGRSGGLNRLTNSQITDMAQRLGFRPTNFKSQKQIVFTDGKVYITQDVTSHTGGLWKMARTPEALASKKTRMGTYDYDLNYIAP